MADNRKTNAVRIIEAAKIPFEIFTYDASDGRIDVDAVAGKIGFEPSVLFKTLVARSGSNVYVFCIPGDTELDLKKAAKIAGEKKIELVAVKELLPLTGYVRGGCSPIGMKKQYPLFLDSSASGRKFLVVSGGAIGLQVKLAPADLIALTGAVTSDLAGGE